MPRKISYGTTETVKEKIVILKEHPSLDFTYRYRLDRLFVEYCKLNNDPVTSPFAVITWLSRLNLIDINKVEELFKIV